MVSIRVVSLMCLAGFLPATAQLVSKSVPTLSSPTDSVLAPAKPDLTPEARGDILMARKMFREAIDVYSLGADSNAILSNKLGIAYHQMLQLDIARKYYVQAIRLNPKYPEAVNNLGTIYYARKQYRKAIGQYNKAIKLAPNSASIYSNLGTAEFSRKKYKEASDAYEKALVLDPEVFEHRNASGTLLQERSVEERAKFHYYLAKTYAKAGNNERALQYIRKALEEGFKDREKFNKEPEFASLKELPEFQELLKMEPRVL
jgi:tetratricopeptide (TPR) repeat protein